MNELIKNSFAPYPNQKMALAISFADFVKAGIARNASKPGTMPFTSDGKIFWPTDSYNRKASIFIEKDKAGNWLFNIQPYLLNRAWCESDSRFVQVLPYVSLITMSDKFPSGKGIFCYQRGAKGTETKLHDDYSIGLGGHIEAFASSPSEFFNVVLECLGRELWEEVEYDAPYPVLLEAMNNFTILHDTTRPVDSVHLCLHFILTVDEKDLGANEDGNIDKGQFVDLGEIIDVNANGVLKFEQWSKVLLEKTIWV